MSEPDTPMPAVPPRVLSEQDDLAVRQTSRFRVALDKVIRGALKSFVDSHGPTLEQGLLNSASKRSASAVWALMAHHPDVRVVVGKFPDEQAKQLAACEAECEKRSAMIRELRAQLAQAVREREEAIADIRECLPPNTEAVTAALIRLRLMGMRPCDIDAYSEDESAAVALLLAALLPMSYDPNWAPQEAARLDSLLARAEAAEAEVATLRAQLPTGMEHCTIRFIECPAGHGRLVADNWIDHGCKACELAALRADIYKKRRHQRAR